MRNRFAAFSLVAVAGVLLVMLAACSSTPPEAGTELRSESGADAPKADDGGEESGQRFTLTDRYDKVRAGARLTLEYDADVNTFSGIVANTTDETLKQVRVEVHLSNGVELGPTSPVDLAPGQSMPISLEATTEPFTSWGAHPEVGYSAAAAGEHGGRESAEHEGAGGSGEHSGDSESEEHSSGP